MQRRRNKHNKFNLVSTLQLRRPALLDQVGQSFCGVALGILVFVLLSCPNLSNASAQDAPDSATGTATTTEIYVKSNISITTQEKLDFEVTPNSDQATFNSKMTTVSVTTNNQTGYGLYLHTTSVDGKLRSRDSSVTQTINPLTQDAAPASSAFASNSWGYSTNNATYKAISTTSQKIISTIAAATEKTHDVYIGAKIGVDLPVGFYTGDVVFSAVANPITVHGLQDLTYMQDMTPKVCEITKNYVSTSDYQRKQLIDSRDGKKYWVAKLADGNCWMQQNLELNLGIAVTPNDTDIATSKTLSGDWWHPNAYWYYTWNAATVGSGATLTDWGAEAPESICPKGWRLPLNDIVNGSYGGLLAAHGITNTATMQSIGSREPLNFYPAGLVISGSVDSSRFGDNGTYWTRVSLNSDSAVDMYWYNSRGTFNVSDSFDKYRAMPIRCVTVSAS